MIEFILELVISFVVSYWMWNGFRWWIGILAFLLMIGMTNFALARNVSE